MNCISSVCFLYKLMKIHVVDVIIGKMSETRQVLFLNDFQKINKWMNNCMHNSPSFVHRMNAFKTQIKDFTILINYVKFQVSNNSSNWCLNKVFDDGKFLSLYPKVTSVKRLLRVPPKSACVIKLDCYFKRLHTPTSF